LDKPMWIHQLLLKDPNPPTFIDGWVYKHCCFQSLENATC
jgi:hypothetical protein